MVAYDSRGGGGPFEALFDDLAITSQLSGRAWKVTATPEGGVVQVGTQVTLTSPDGVTIRYTLDGTPPTKDSRKYETPIVLDKPGVWDLRFATGSGGGRVSDPVMGELYEARP